MKVHVDVIIRTYNSLSMFLKINDGKSVRLSKPHGKGR